MVFEKKYKGVLFDFDGVVIDSMHQHYDAWSKAFAEKNITFTKESFFQLEGQGLSTIARMLGEPYGLKEKELLDIIEAKARHYYSFEKIQFYDSFFELIDFLKNKHIPMAVVTGGNRDRVSNVIENYFKDYFSAIVTIDDVKNGKPYPEPFTKGAEKLLLNPADCIVIENAPLGIKAGKAAGCFVMAVKTTLTEKYLNQANLILENFQDVKIQLQKLI